MAYFADTNSTVTKGIYRLLFERNISQEEFDTLDATLSGNKLVKSGI